MSSGVAPDGGIIGPLDPKCHKLGPFAVDMLLIIVVLRAIANNKHHVLCSQFLLVITCDAFCCLQTGATNVTGWIWLVVSHKNFMFTLVSRSGDRF